MDLQLEGKRAIVTGASRGIGLAIARELAAEGVVVALVARDGTALEAAAEPLRSAGYKVVHHSADVTDEAAVERMVETVADQMGGVDILVNNAARAGDGRLAGLAEVTDDTLRVEVETKVLGYLRCIRAAAPYMLVQGWGRIINVSGMAARQTGSIPLSIRNVAIVAMTKNLADELGPKGINVNVLHPGLTWTERTPKMIAARANLNGVSEAEMIARMTEHVSIGRFITTDEIAAVVAFLASPRAVALNGEVIAVGGGVMGAIRY